MSPEDPYSGIRPYINHQANLLLDPIVGKDDLFRNGNSNYRRDIVHGPEFTKAVEVWPNQDGSLVERESLFVAREIKRVSISYPLTSLLLM